MTSITHPDRDLIGLGIRQPWAELILRGIKTIEVRSQPTNVRGPIYLYVGKKFADIPAAGRIVERHELDPDALPMGSIVGTVDIVDCRPCEPLDEPSSCVPSTLMKNKFGWRLANPVRFDEPMKPRFLPYGVWFYPFKRRPKSS
ncbi:MAG: ASCH domain-containing protein [Planctomycetaceae bacterium]|nr:ASCH domain-containing protein [Planctomycetaceae bacterium]